jgi:2-oxoglutarate dehydrogenase E1 component
MMKPVTLPSSANLPFVEELYAAYQGDPCSVSEAWQEYFATLGDGKHAANLGPRFRPRSIFNPVAPRADAPDLLLQHRVDRLIRAYRVRGHIQAKLDPLSDFVPYVPELDLEYYGFTEDDLHREFACETIAGPGRLPLRDIVQRLREVYCQSIGAQFMHIDDLKIRHWLQERIEGTRNRTELSRDEQLRILTRLTDAVVFEEFIRKKFIGAKTFSLEGAESLVPLLDLAIERAAEQGVKEIVLGMAHRGRLNLLANIIGKSPREIFREFEDRNDDLDLGRGDVKYHLGYSADHVTRSGREVHLSLCFNPSHLEFVNPVALGRMRAKQDRVCDEDRNTGMVFLIHGDAAFIGEGIVQETLNLSRLRGYAVGGSVHVLINNQIGFTTPPIEARSSVYATSVAKMLGSPLLHVNGEDPDAVAHCIRLAMDFRQKFKRDVFLDMYCYRRLGHNEGDEPAFTQPKLYRLIEKRKPVREGYLDHLLKLGGVTREEADQIAERCRQRLEYHLREARKDEQPKPEATRGIWAGYHGGPASKAGNPVSGVKKHRLAELLKKQMEFPKGFTPHPKIAKGMEHRLAMACGHQPLDWSAAESLAIASLATDGVRVRLSGQDSERGTFSQRHAVLHDYETGQVFVPLANLSPKQATVQIINSPLSEAGVLGFEYGFSLDYPDALVMWEAQFGDFVNAAQVIIDQFISSAESKWRRLSGLVLLLPHGFEGQGPEHSSARLERFLTLAAEDNIQVAYPTTPAQYFHLLRRQTLRKWRKPLVVMTPKGLLRHPQAVSPLDDCAHGRFQNVIPDDRRASKRLLLCTGKIFYELLQRREELKRADVGIVRVEQLYPFPRTELEAALKRYTDDTPAMWVQEEPENMGAWRYMQITCGSRLLARFPFTSVCRPAAASPTSGSTRAHKLEQEKLLGAAFE